MKYFSEAQFTVDHEYVAGRLESIRQGKMKAGAGKELLSKIFGLLDLTSLSEQDNHENIGHLCQLVNHLDDAYPDLPSPAAICVYPELLDTVRTTLTNPLVSVASVAAGFPASQTFLPIKLKEVELAIAMGADEIDMVMSVGKFLAGQYEKVYDEIKRIKELIGTVHLKVILETGVLPDFVSVQKAAYLSMDAGADFIKTSTGKAGTGATPEAFLVMCESVKSYYGKTGRKVGLKPAGGISTEEDALLYYAIVEDVLGEEWLNPEKFRIGASRLANNLIRSIYEKEANFNYF